MSAIGPGDWVECVDVSPFEDIACPLTLGALYCVQSVYEMWDGVGLVLCNMPAPVPFDGYAIERFKPIYRPRADFIESLKQPAPSIPEVEPA